MAQSILALKENRERKNKLLRQMLELTQKEKTQLLADQVEELVETTRSWEKIAAEIDGLETGYTEALRPLLVQDAERPLGEHTEAVALLEQEARDILGQVQAVQVECNTLAAERMEQYKSSLKGVQKTAQRVNSYTNPYTISEDGVYFDQKK